MVEISNERSNMWNVCSLAQHKYTLNTIDVTDYIEDKVELKNDWLWFGQKLTGHTNGTYSIDQKLSRI